MPPYRKPILRDNPCHAAHHPWPWLRLLSCLMVAVVLGACAQRPPASALVQGHKPEDVPVLGAMPMSQPQAKAACASDAAVAAASSTPSSGALPDTGFCVWYEYQGQSYTVVLPNDPGETLTLQIPVALRAPVYGAPMAAAPAGVSPVGAAPYPFLYPRVYFYGGYYRPRAYAPHVAPPFPPRTWTRPGWRNRRPLH